MVWHLIADPALDAPRFNLRQNKLIARAPTALSFLDTGRTVAPECPTPTADRPAMNPDSQRRFHVRRALLNKKNGANTQSFLCPLIQFAAVAKLHQRRLSDLLRHVICLHGILVVISQFWNKLKSDIDGNWIFFDFIEKERNNILKEFSFGATLPPAEDGSLLAYDGTHLDGAQLYREAVYWWRAQLDHLEAQLTAVDGRLDDN